MSKTKLEQKRARVWRALVSAVLVAACLWLVAANWQTFRRSFIAVAHTRPAWLAAGLALTALTFCIAAATYGLLALKPLRYRQTVVVELAAAFANRLLPAGLGGLGLHGLYLYRRRHTPAQATAVVSVNNLLGIAAHLSLLVVLICFRPKVLTQFTSHTSGFHWWYVAVALAAMSSILLLPKLRGQLHSFGLNLITSLRLMQPPRVVAAAVCALLLTATYTLVLYSAAHAVGVRLGVLETFIVFSLGMLVGTATPTPGGLVGVEAGLFAGLVGYGASSADAGAAVLLYRLVTYWLPLVPGLFALLLARSRSLV